jgi:hypothetical protein
MDPGPLAHLGHADGLTLALMVPLAIVLFLLGVRGSRKDEKNKGPRKPGKPHDRG